MSIKKQAEWMNKQTPKALEQFNWFINKMAVVAMENPGPHKKDEFLAGAYAIMLIGIVAMRQAGVPLEEILENAKTISDMADEGIVEMEKREGATYNKDAN